MAFAIFLSAIGAVPTLIDRLQGHEYLTPPFSPWGFLMSLIFWITQTLILVGVSQVVWGHLKKDPHEPVHFLPSEKVQPQLFLWSIAFTVMTFVPHLGSWLAVNMASNPALFTPLPTLPIPFYFLAFIPLMMVNQQFSIWAAMKLVRSTIKVNFISLLKLALTAEALFLVFATLGIESGKFICDALSIPASVIVDEVIWVLVTAPSWVINSAMIAVAYTELQGLSAVGHQEPRNPVYEGR
jgi:flagellar biosynthesis protein FlhB